MVRGNICVTDHFSCYTCAMFIFRLLALTCIAIGLYHQPTATFNGATLLWATGITMMITSTLETRNNK